VTLLEAEDRRDFQQSVRSSLARCWSSATRAADGDMEAVWTLAHAQGWTSLGHEDALDATLVAVEELGRVACPLPLVDTHVAVSLLMDDVVRARTAGREPRAVVAVAQHEQSLTAAFVECASTTTDLVVIDPVTRVAAWHDLRDETAELVCQEGLAVPAWHAVRATSPPWQRVALSSETVDEALLLLTLGLAGRAVAAAGRAHELAVEHACRRRQFGRLVGSFQAVSHRAADGALELTAARHLLDQAVQLHGNGRPQWRVQALAAVEEGLHAAVQVQFGAQHTLAATGYFEEHEAPWLFRRVHADVTRARALPLPGGGLADRLVDGGEQLPSVDPTERAQRTRHRVRALLRPWVDAAAPAAFSDHGSTNDLPDAVDLLADNGLLGLGWPAEVDGGAAGPAELLAFTEELGYASPPLRGVMMGVDSVAPALIAFGTPEQKQRYLPRIRRGAISFGLGYSEPEAGSDLASLRTRAVRVGDGWSITGQKLWGTGVHRADYILLAARTDPQATPPHAGISMFIVPTSVAGLTIQQHTALSGAVSCTTFYDDVRLPADALVGQEGGGWAVLLTALAAERVLMGAHVARLHRLMDVLLQQVRLTPSLALPGSANRAVVTRLAARLQAARSLVAAGVRATADGKGALLEVAMAKVLSAELSEEFAVAALAMLGPGAAVAAGRCASTADGVFEAALRLSVMDVVAGGTNDIQRNLIARGLGLPR
jgi:alkylation response protein AidB-like acyl-CoA dehydrogenase